MESSQAFLESERKRQKKELLNDEGKFVRGLWDEAVLMCELMERTCTKRLFNETRHEIIKLEQECLTLVRKDLESKSQRLTMLRQSYTELENGSKTKPESPSFKLTFGS